MASWNSEGEAGFLRLEFRGHLGGRGGLWTEIPKAWGDFQVWTSRKFGLQIKPKLWSIVHLITKKKGEQSTRGSYVNILHVRLIIWESLVSYCLRITQKSHFSHLVSSFANVLNVSRTETCASLSLPIGTPAIMPVELLEYKMVVKAYGITLMEFWGQGGIEHFGISLGIGESRWRCHPW